MGQHTVTQNLGNYHKAKRTRLEKACAVLPELLPPAYKKCLFVYFDSLRPSQYFFSHVGTGLPGLNQY